MAWSYWRIARMNRVAALDMVCLLLGHGARAHGRIGAGQSGILGPLEVVMQCLNRVYTGIFHLPVAQFSHRAFRDSRPRCYRREIRKSNSAQTREDG